MRLMLYHNFRTAVEINTRLTVTSHKYENEFSDRNIILSAK